MKEKIKLLKYLFFFSIFFLFLLYVLPGELIDFNSPKKRTIFQGSIKHFYYFSYLTSLGLFVYLKDKNYLKVVFLLFLLSAFVEVIHLYVPGREFSYYDILANLSGYLFGFLLITLLKKYIKKV
jgi:VanZ family protein